jgi:hypothetical protein
MNQLPIQIVSGKLLVTLVEDGIYEADERCYVIAIAHVIKPSYNSHTLPIKKGIAAFIKFKSGSNDRPNPSSTSMLTTTLDMAGSIST